MFKFCAKTFIMLTINEIINFQLEIVFCFWIRFHILEYFRFVVLAFYS